MKKRGCLSCLEPFRERRLRPYCSIVCRVLGQAGLGWRLNPYRIVDLCTGPVLTTGPAFDLTAKGIARLQKKAEILQQIRQDETRVVSTAPTAAYLLQEIPQPIHSFSEGVAS
jgi:hypothetical protein